MQRKTGQQPCAFSAGFTGASAALRELFSVSKAAHRVKKRGGSKEHVKSIDSVSHEGETESLSTERNEVSSIN